MGATQDNEAAVEEIRTLLENQLPAELDAIETEKSDGITLNDPVDYFFGERQTVNETPVVHVVPGSGSLQQSTRFMENDLSVSIFVTIKDNRPENLKKKIMRYVKAVQKVLEKSEGSATSLGFDFGRGAGINYSPTLTHTQQDSVFLQGGSLSILIQNREDFA